MNRKEDNTYHIMREKSAIQWLEGIEASEHRVNKSGAKLTIEHIEYLNRKIKELEAKNKMKDEYLKKLKERVNAINNKSMA